MEGGKEGGALLNLIQTWFKLPIDASMHGEMLVIILAMKAQGIVFSALKREAGRDLFAIEDEISDEGPSWAARVRGGAKCTELR